MSPATTNPTKTSNVVVVLGASGDLAAKKIYPTLWSLYRHKALPQGCSIFGYARSKLSVAKLREKCAATVFAKKGQEEMLEQFWAANHYVAGSYDEKKDFELLNKAMAEVEKKEANRMFYLSLPTSVFKPVTTMLKVKYVVKMSKTNQLNPTRLPACHLLAGPE